MPDSSIRSRAEQVDVRGPRFAAFLNAAFGIRPSCALYPAAPRLLPHSASESPVSH